MLICVGARYPRPAQCCRDPMSLSRHNLWRGSPRTQDMSSVHVPIWDRSLHGGSLPVMSFVFVWGHASSQEEQKKSITTLHTGDCHFFLSLLFPAYTNTPHQQYKYTINTCFSMTYTQSNRYYLPQPLFKTQSHTQAQSQHSVHTYTYTPLVSTFTIYSCLHS